MSARFKVWFSLERRAVNAGRSVSKTSSPAASNAASAADPCTQWIDARRFVPASVSASAPFGNSKTASVIRPGGFACGQPAQPTRDHEVQHEKPLTFERENEALAEASHVDDTLSCGLLDRRHRGAQHERIENPRALEALGA